MKKIEIRNIKKYSVSILALALIMIVFAFGITVNNNNANAADITMGSTNYSGSKYYSYHDIVGTSISMNNVVLTPEEFAIHLFGRGAKRNILKPFYYAVTFTLLKGSTQLGSKLISFKVESGYEHYVLFTGSNLSGSGTYTLKWSGTISSQVVARFDDSFTFTIA